MNRRKSYPKNWPQISFAVRKAANWKCQYCGISQGASRYSRRTGAEYIIYLHCAHLDHDPGNPAPRLACLCPTCHGKYDFQTRIRKRDFKIFRLKLARAQKNSILKIQSAEPGAKRA